MQETWVQYLGGEDLLKQGGNGNPFQYSCLGNPMDRGAWWAMLQRVKKSWTWLRDWTTCVKWSESCSVVSDSLQLHGLYSPWNSPSRNTRVGSLCLLQGIFPTKGSKPGLLHCRQILYQLSHNRSSRILEWVGYPFSSGSSWPRNQTGVLCISGGFFELRSLNSFYW